MYQLPKLAAIKSLTHGFSSFAEGNMSFLWGDGKTVLANRSGFLQKLGIEPEKCAVMSISDSNAIKTIDDETPVGIGKDEKIRADALITARKDLFLFLLIADCLPVILYEPAKSVLALAHCGRKSTGGELLKKVIASMKSGFGIASENLLVGIGPGIHRESYKLESFPEKDSAGWKGFVFELPDGSAALDLVGYNKLQLMESGVKEKNIEISPIDTAADSGFFSHYRSRRTGEAEGRFAAVAGMI